MIRVKNRTRYPVTLPAPFQGVLGGSQEEVLDITAKEFYEAVGGDESGVFNVVSIAASSVPGGATVTVDRTITDVDLVQLIDAGAPGFSGTGYATTQRIEVSTIAGIATVDLTKSSGGDDIDEDVTYTIKDVGGNAATNNITVSCSSTFTGGSSSTYTIDTDGGSIGVYKNSATGRFVVLPGMSSGGASTLGGLTNVPAAADTLGAGDDQEVLVWDGNISQWTVGPLDKRNRVTFFDYESVPAGGGPFNYTSPHQLPSNYDVYVLETGANQGAVIVKLPTIASTTSLLGSSRSARLYLKVKSNAASYAVTVEPNAADSGATIDGAASKVLGTNWQSITLVVSGTDWLIL